jgi:hypothetical protein
MIIALTNPCSTGADLSRSFRDYGVAPLHIWGPQYEDRYFADANPQKVLLTESNRELLPGLGVHTFVPGSDFGVELAEDLTADYSWPSNVPELRDARVSKFAMQERLRVTGVPHIPSALVTSPHDVERVAESFVQFPVVVKPTRGAGSDGVMFCYDVAEIVEACGRIFTEARWVRARAQATIQEYQSGPQIIVNTVSIDGRHLVTDVYANEIDESGGEPFTRSIRLERSLTDDLQKAVAYCLECLDALGQRDGAAHCELRLTPGGPRLIELNSRIMGGTLAADPFRRALGRSQADFTAERYVHPQLFESRFDEPYRPQAALAIVFPKSPVTGEIESVDECALRRLESFAALIGVPRSGDSVASGRAIGTMGVNPTMVVLCHEDDQVFARDMAMFDDDAFLANFVQVRERSESILV